MSGAEGYGPGCAYSPDADGERRAASACPESQIRVSERRLACILLCSGAELECMLLEIQVSVPNHDLYCTMVGTIGCD